MIIEFYAVTMTSVYHARQVVVNDEDVALVRKVAQKGGTASKINVGDTLQRGTLLAITSKSLQMFRAKNGERDPAHIRDLQYLGHHTSPWTGLFRSKERAMKCLGVDDLVPRDPRFAAETNAILNAIGNNHPVFCVCV